MIGETAILMSIRPRHAQAILDGRKTCEFRRRLPARIATGLRIVIYECVPTGKVVGEARVAEIVSLGPEDMWSAMAARGGVSRDLFDDYFRGVALAHAIVLADVSRYETPRDLLATTGLRRAPQSYCYL